MQEYLVGQVYGHPRQPDGALVTTSAVVRRDGCVAVTASGTQYELEDDSLVEAGSLHETA